MAKSTYSDGSIEDIILATLDDEEKFREIYETPGACFHNFVDSRRNLLSCYPFKSGAKILEIGAGMGALTGLLCEKCSEVIAVEESPKRADIIRKRCATHSNLKVVTEDVYSLGYEKEFDYVTIIGVLEYVGINNTGTENPYTRLLKLANRFLKDDGVLLLAIENKFGAKYWSGAAEDHTGIPFDGINDYIDNSVTSRYELGGVRTFSKGELNNMIIESGFKAFKYYYPLPDYKFPIAIYSDNRLPDDDAIRGIKFHYPIESEVVLSEKVLYREMLNEGLFDFFANSYLIEVGKTKLPDNGIEFATFKRDYAARYQIATLKYSGENFIEKKALNKNSEIHLKNCNDYLSELRDRGLNTVNSQMISDRALKVDYIASVQTIDLFKNALKSDDEEACKKLIDLLEEELLKSSQSFIKGPDGPCIIQGLKEDAVILEQGYIDLTFINSFYEDGRLIFFDQEWKIDNVPLKFILYRAIKYSGDEYTSNMLQKYYEYIGLSVNEKELFDEYESLMLSEMMDPVKCSVFDPMMLNKGYSWKEKNLISRYSREIEERDRLIEEYRQLEYRMSLVADEYRADKSIAEDRVNNLQREKDFLKKEIEKKINRIKVANQENDKLKRDIDELIDDAVRSGRVYSADYVEDLCNVLEDKNAQIERLLEVEREWENEKNSHAYKKILKKRARRNKLFPKNSKRRLLLDVAYKCYTDPKTMRQILTPHKIKTFIRVLRKDGMGRVNSLLDENIDVAGAKAHPETVSLIVGLEPLIDDYSVESFEKLSFKKWNNPLVSIVIPVYNEFNYTYNCLKSILKNSGEVKYEVIVANDCSTDCTSEVESIAENVRLITTEKNCRFLLNCNNAAKEARGKYILFLNNDTQVRPNWLQPLVDLIESDEKIGMVGSKLIYPDGKLQEAGGILWKDGSAWNYGHRQDPEASEFNYVKEADYISGAAIMIKADLWNEIGGFDELFVPAYCEDSDLAFEVRKHGYKVMYQPKSVVVHFEGVSNGTDTSSGLKHYQVENSEKFCEKWKEVLEQEHFDNAQNVFQARDKSAKKKCILFIDHYVPQFDKDAGSRTVFAYLKLFVNKGYNVKFLGDNFYRDEPYTEVLQQMGVEVLYGPYYSENWKQWIKENASAFDFVFMNRPHISKNYIDFVRENTKAKIIYYGHDLHYVRERREYELTKNKDLLKSSEDWKKLEYDLMHKADMVYYPSQVEVDEIASVDPSVKVGALTAYIYPEIEEKEYVALDRRNILFVGGFGHGPNVDAVNWFTAEIFPKILEKNPDIVFEIVGSKAPDEIKNLASKNIVVHGFVSDEKLAQLYSECKMTVIPLRYGAGIKGKVVEAMSQGVPVVTTSVGAEGILDSGDILFVEDDADKFANLVCDLYDDAESLKKASAKSYKYIEKYYSEDAAWNVIKAEFE